MKLCHAGKLDRLGGPSMWIEWGNLTRQNKACSLGSGYPDFALHPDLKDELLKASEDPCTSWYTRAQGHPKLLEEIVAAYSPLLGRKMTTDEAIITIGAYQGIYWTFEAFLDEGDEVIVFEPMFDAYQMDSVLSNSRVVTVQLKIESNSWVLDKEQLRKSFTNRTKMIVLNTPHNPTGKVFNRDELEFISQLSKEYNCLVLSDEVYDRYVLDGYEHLRIAALPGMWERTITLCSVGKMFGITGWRLGWAYGHSALIEKLFRICLCDTFGASTLLQETVAGMLKRQRLCEPPKESYYVWAGNIFKDNYKKLYKAFTDAEMPVITTEGGFFMVVDCSRRSFDFQNSEEYVTSEEELDVKIAKGIVNHFKLAILPLSLFYDLENKNKLTNYLRVCYAKSPETVDLAVKIIESFN